MQAINAFCVLVIIGFFALTVDGKHMQHEARAGEIVAKYAAPETIADNGLTRHQAFYFAALAKHMGKTR